LAELGIEKENQGCYYNGKWTANGEWYHSNNPSSGKAIAKVRFGNVDDYEGAIKDMIESK